MLNNVYSIDHSPLTGTLPPGGTAGYHTVAHLIPVSTVATNGPNNQPINGYTSTNGYGQVLSAQINDGLNSDETLFFLSGGNRLYQFHGNRLPIAAASGLSYMVGPGQGAAGAIGAIITQWGKVNAPLTTATQSFTQTFPNNCFGVWTNIFFTASFPGNPAVILVKPSTTGFTWVYQGSSGSTAGTGFFWYAIGN